MLSASLPSPLLATRRLFSHAYGVVSAKEQRLTAWRPTPRLARPQLRHRSLEPCTAFLKSAFGPGAAWWAAPKPANMSAIINVQQLVDELEDSRERLVVVEFYASWCGGCKAVFPRVLSLAERTPNVRWLLVDVDENKALCKKLGVTGLPSFHLFAGGVGCVEQLTIAASKFQTLVAAVDRYNVPWCTLPTHGAPATPPLQGFSNVKPHRHAMAG